MVEGIGNHKHYVLPHKTFRHDKTTTTNHSQVNIHLYTATFHANRHLFEHLRPEHFKKLNKRTKRRPQTNEASPLVRDASPTNRQQSHGNRNVDNYD